MALIASACAPSAKVEPAPAARLAVKLPGPARAGGEVAVLENRACEKCHADIAAEWRGSMHQRSQIDPAYQRAFAIEPMAFCQGCHAPEASPDGPVSAHEADLGIGCVTCHSPSGERGAVLAGHGSSASASPHPILREPAFAADGGCAGCHEFRFPGVLDRRHRLAEDMMQSTALEHERSSLAQTSCADCHMPGVGGEARRHRSHAFSGARDPVAMKAAIQVTAERVSARVMRFHLAPGRVGHAMPTGDLFRRIEVLGEVVGPDTGSLGRESRYLTRHFGLPRNGRRRLLADDRVGAKGSDPVVVELDLGDPAEGRPIAWQVAYQRVEHPRGVDESDALVEGEVVLASGVADPLPSRSSKGP